MLRACWICPTCFRNSWSGRFLVRIVSACCLPNISVGVDSCGHFPLSRSTSSPRFAFQSPRGFGWLVGRLFTRLIPAIPGVLFFSFLSYLTSKTLFFKGMADPFQSVHNWVRWSRKFLAPLPHLFKGVESLDRLCSTCLLIWLPFDSWWICFLAAD